MNSQPPYIFQIDEIREHPNIQPIVDNEGYWIPSIFQGWNYRITEGATGSLWYCNGSRIYSIPPESLPPQSTLYSTFSVFFSGGRGFRVLRGDALAPPGGEAWHCLRFIPGPNSSSFLTNAGTQDTITCQRNDQFWPFMLLPDIYHGPRTTNMNVGGLIGELPIFLALVALSMPPETVVQDLPRLFQGSQWHVNVANQCRKCNVSTMIRLQY